MVQISEKKLFSKNYFPVYGFKKSGIDGNLLFQVNSEINVSENTEPENVILCRLCGNVITKPEYFFEINGSNRHTFINPAGNIFTIGCFKSAEGCLDFGELTDDFTWFPGFQWCCVICSGCGLHLGWLYSSAGGRFYGLILNRLAE